MNSIHGVQLKIKRAKKHICELEAALNAFRVTNPYEIRANNHPMFLQFVQYRVVRASPIPDDIPLIAGDALHNLRSALDHMAQCLVRNPTEKTRRATKFPIADSFEKYKTEAPGKIKWIPEDAKRCIESLKPYKGGNDAFWQLKELDNIDKHRVLLTLGVAMLASDYLTMLGRKFPVMRRFAEAGYWLIEETPCPLKEGEVFFEDFRMADSQENLKFAFAVTFGEPEVIEAKPILETIMEFCNLVEKVVDILSRLA